MKRACFLFLVAGAMVAVALLRPQGGGTETPSFELSSGSFGAGGGSASSASFGTESATGGLTGGESSSASFGAGADFFSAATCVDDGDGLDAASEETLGTNPCTFDTDVDGYHDGQDNCPVDSNPGQENNVHPGTSEGDHCEDTEPDGVFDIDDNCPDDSNTAQTNTDADLNLLGATIDGAPIGDDLGDACDDDIDDDSFNGTTVLTQVPGTAATDCPGGSVDIWANCVESYLGTNAADNCTGAPGTGGDAWPPDISQNGTVSGGDATAIFPFWLLTDIDPGWDPRYDLTANAIISGGDVTRIFPFWLADCT